MKMNPMYRFSQLNILIAAVLYIFLSPLAAIPSLIGSIFFFIAGMVLESINKGL